jgi:hypothetical protein
MLPSDEESVVRLGYIMADVLVDGRSCKGVDWPVLLTPEDIPFDDGLGGRGSLGRTDCGPVVASAGNS